MWDYSHYFVMFIRLNKKSRVKRELHARFWEKLGLKCSGLLDKQPDMRKKMLPLFAPTLLLLAAMLAGCNKDETDANQLPDGKHPLTLTATMEGLTATRATPDGTWDGTEKVAVIIDNETVQEYTVAADGKLTAPSDVTPYYWQNATETKSVLAWFPYSTTKPDKFEVKADQSGVGYAQSDMLWSSKEISYRNSTLTFQHLPAKVVVNLKKGEGVTESEVQNATVTLVSQNLTSGTIGANWTVTATTTGNSEIKTNVLTTPTDGFQKTVQALVVPQQMQNKQFIKVTIGTDAAARDYYYTTADDDANLESGTQYTYAITVQKSGITVTASGATDWTGTTSAVTSKIFKEGFSAADLKIGDFYYSDGATSDGGYREYADNTKTTLPIMPVLTDISNQPRTVIGIVYWVGDNTENDPLLAKDKSVYTHGLVVALHEAKNPLTSAAGKMKWSVGSEKVNDWTNSDVNKVDITELNKMQGYANTVALKTYNESSNVQNSAELKVLPIAAIEQYQACCSAPTNSSGWYLPSVMELQYMCWGQGNSQSTTGRELLNTQFAKAGGTSLDASGYYWSSSELARNSAGACYVYFDNGYVGGSYKSNDGGYVRRVLAF